MIPFNQKIWELTKRVPKGRLTTYKILAEAAGTKAYRAVGQSMKRNPFSPKVPCHRVVKSDSSVGGFFGNIQSNSKEVRAKIKMLRKEGVKIKNNKVVQFKKVLFYF